MRGYISGYNFAEILVEKYWAPTKNTNIKELVKNAIYSGDYWAARKVDGNFILFIKDEDGNLFFRTRNAGVNGFLNKIDYVPHLLKELKSVPNGTVLLGEAYLPQHEQSRAMTTIFGCLVNKALERQEKGEKINFYIFDCLAYSNENIMNSSMTERVAVMDIIYKHYLAQNPYIQCAKYYEGQELEDYIAYCRSKDYEGVVLQRKDGHYEPNKRPARKSIKVKKELDSEIDCYLTGNYQDSTWSYTGKEVENWKYWFNLKTNEKIEGLLYDEFAAGAPLEPITKGAFYGWAGSVEVGLYDNGHTYSLGWISNVAEEVKKGIVNDPDSYYHKVARVSCMQLEKDTGKMRHAKILEWRNPEDIDWKDCTYEKVFGGKE